MPTKTLTIRVPEELHRKLKYVAWRDGASMNELVAELIEGALEDVQLPVREEPVEEVDDDA